MRDPKVEQYLDDEGYEWDYVESLSFDSITLDYNPARWSVKLDDERVVAIGIDVERKMKMPAVVVAITATSRYALLSGRHRIEGSKLADATAIAAYIVTTVLDNFELEFQPYALNAKEGRSPTNDEKLRQLAYLWKKNPERSKPALCRKMGIKVHSLDQYLKLEHATDRAVRLNVLTDIRKLEPEIRIAVDDMLSLDAVFRDAVTCLAYVGWKGRNAKNLIKSLANAPSEKSAMAMIKDTSAGHEELVKRLKRAGRKPVQTPDQIWFYAARNAKRKWPEHPDPKTFDNAETLAEAVETIKDLRGQCNEWIEKGMEALATWERSKKERDKDQDQDGNPLFGPGS